MYTTQIGRGKVSVSIWK